MKRFVQREKGRQDKVSFIVPSKQSIHGSQHITVCGIDRAGNRGESFARSTNVCVLNVRSLAFSMYYRPFKLLEVLNEKNRIWKQTALIQPLRDIPDAFDASYPLDPSQTEGHSLAFQTHSGSGEEQLCPGLAVTGYRE